MSRRLTQSLLNYTYSNKVHREYPTSHIQERVSRITYYLIDYITFLIAAI